MAKKVAKVTEPIVVVHATSTKWVEPDLPDKDPVPQTLDAFLQKTDGSIDDPRDVSCYFVSGHLDLSPEEFLQFYVPRILEGMALGGTFIVGDAIGCDERTQRLFKAAGLLDRLTVYHMKERPRVYVGEPACLLGGFRNDDHRDTAMTEASTHDIAWVRQGREKSGTARNLARRIS